MKLVLLATKTQYNRYKKWVFNKKPMEVFQMVGLDYEHLMFKGLPVVYDKNICQNFHVLDVTKLNARKCSDMLSKWTQFYYKNRTSNGYIIIKG